MSHRGITNAQHSYESNVNPGTAHDEDHSATNRDIAKEFSRRFLEHLASKDRSFYRAMKNYEGGFSIWGEVLPREEKRELLDKDGWDLSPVKLADYYALAKKYEAIKDQISFHRWDVDAVFKTVLSLI